MQPLDYLQTTGGLIWTAACVPLGFLLTFVSYLIINKMPAKWLCDYDEEPTEDLLSGKRVRYGGSGIIVSVITAVCLVLCRLQFNKGFDIYFAVFALLITIILTIAVCDIKYTIIPDQLTAVVAVLAIAISVYDIVRSFRILHFSWWSPLVGLAVGAGLMLIIDLIGMLIYKKQGMGFGDVKLFTAIGILTGLPGTVSVFVVAVILATICFCIIKLVIRSGEKSSEDEAEENDKAESGLDTLADEENTDSEKADNESIDDENTEDADGAESGYLAFGPYIAAAVIMYMSLFDVIILLTENYLKLFNL